VNGPRLNRLGSVLCFAAYKSVDQPVESLAISLLILPVAKISGDFTHDVRLTGWSHFLEQVVINPDGKKDILLFAIFALQRSPISRRTGPALEGVAQATDYKLVV